MYPPSTRKVLERIQAHEKDEHLRLLYVALTRAREQVMMTSSGRVGKNSWQTAIGMNLEEGFHEGNAYAYEVLCEVPELQPPSPNVENFASSPANEELSGRPSEHLRAPHDPSVAITAHERAKQMLQLDPTRTSVTDLLHERREKPNGPRNFVHLGARLEAVRRGLRIHKLFEILVRRQTHDLGVLGLAAQDPDASIIQNALHFLLRQTQIPYAEIFKNGHAEWSFAFRRANPDGTQQDVRGQIDVWATVGDVTWIVDYKTGQFAFRDSAFAQIDIYADALRAFGIKGKIYAAAVFPLEEKIETRAVAGS